MADDMGICPYANEAAESYGYRVIYSALGLWCLKSALSEKENIKGISKSAQSHLLQKYIEMCPTSKHFLFGSRTMDVAVFIRNIYEQTGYLLTLDNNFNVLNNTGETVGFSDIDHLYLGIPAVDYSLNGLGIHCSCKSNEIKLKDYMKINYDECDFDERDIDIDKLEFFNPFYCGNVSKAWQKRMTCSRTIARENTIGPYYRVMRIEDGKLLYADENRSDELDALTGAEFRRLYIAIKKHYDNPMQLLICPIDEEYSHIKILGQLPNREYYYLLMNAWPKKGFSDRNNFIIRNKLTAQITAVLGALGFTVRDGEFYG